MFERFSKTGRQAIMEAVRSAGELGHNFVGTEHLLLGLLRVPEGTAYEVLGGAGVTTDRVQPAIERIIGPGIDRDALASIGIDFESVRRAAEAAFGPGSLEEAIAGRRARRWSPGPAFTPRSKKVLELALRETLSLKQRSIGPEHVLLAIVREGRGVAAQVLDELAPDTDWRQQVLERIRRAS